MCETHSWRFEPQSLLPTPPQALLMLGVAPSVYQGWSHDHPNLNIYTHTHTHTPLKKLNFKILWVFEHPIKKIDHPKKNLKTIIKI